MTDWGIQDLRASWFKPLVDGLHAVDIFAVALGQEPDAVQRNKAPTPSSPFLTQASSEIGKIMYTILVQPGRIDLRAQAVQEPTAPPREVDIPNAIETIRSFVRSAKAAAPALGNVTRVALATTLRQRLENPEKVSTFILEKVLGEVPFTDGRDTSFQINRRRKFGFDNTLLMNRVIRYDTIASQVLLMPVNLQEGFQTAFPTTAQENYVTLSCDLNNVPTGREFSPDDQAAMFVDLLTETELLAADGSLAQLGDNQ